MGNPPGVLRILIVPYLASFRLSAYAVEAGWTIQNVSARNAAKAIFPIDLCLLKSAFDILISPPPYPGSALRVFLWHVAGAGWLRRPPNLSQTTIAKQAPESLE